MKFKVLSLALLLGVFLPSLSAQAAKIANLNVSADADHLNLLWEPLSDSDFDNADGYAVQWSDRQTNVKITESVTYYQPNNVDDSALRRNTFENNTPYFFRVYTYKIDDDNNKTLGNGSDMLKFTVDFLNAVTTEKIAVTDPVINTSTGSETDVSDFEFGTLRKYPYDTFVDFFWSHPREMTSSDFDDFMIVLSEKSDMSDPLLEAKISSDANSVRITGLSADKNYYAQGHFHKNTNTFGGSNIRSFRTIAAIPRDSSTRQSRNIIKVENRAIRKVDANDASSSSTETDTNEADSSSTSTTVSTSSQSSIDSANQSEVSRKIADLKRQISQLQSELRRWEARLDNNNKTTSSTSSTSSSSGLSVRERLRLILEAKRNQ